MAVPNLAINYSMCKRNLSIVAAMLNKKEKITNVKSKKYLRKYIDMSMNKNERGSLNQMQY